jgi:site-specific DNA recombinase
MRIAVYVRVSTQTPCQTQSIEHQLQRLRAHVQTQGWELPDEHVFRDDGYSGASLNRPGLDRLRERIAQRAFDRVLITAPDRLARKYVHQVLLLEEFDQHDCQTEFLERPMSQDPHDQLVLQIRGAVAEYERSLITDRMRRGRQAKLRAGLLLPWTRPPYGYRVDPDRPRDPRGVRLEPAEAVTVAEMAAYYLEDGRSLFGLAKHLMAMGVLTPSGKKRWNQATVRGILTNPVYIGKVYAGRNRARPARIRRSALKPLGNPTSGHEPASPEDWILVAEVPAILTQEQFDLIQAKLAQNQKFASRNNTSHEYLLRALVSCGLCGLACTARSCHPGYAYYTCRAKQHPIQSCRDERCPSRFIPATQLDALVWQDLCEILTHPELITQALERAQGGQWLPQELQARQENLRKARRSLEQQLERLTEAYLSNVIPLAEYQRRRQDLEQRQVTLEQQAQQLMASVDRQVELAGLAIGIEDFCQRVQRGLADATFEQKRQLVELLIDRVVVTNDEVEIRYVIPTHPRSEHIRFCHLRKDYFNPHTAAIGLQGFTPAGEIGSQQPGFLFSCCPMGQQIDGIGRLSSQQGRSQPTALSWTLDQAPEVLPGRLSRQQDLMIGFLAQDILPSPGIQLLQDRHCPEFTVPDQQHRDVGRQQATDISQQGQLFAGRTVSFRTFDPSPGQGDGSATKGQADDQQLMAKAHFAAIGNQPHFLHRVSRGLQQPPGNGRVPLANPHGWIVQPATQSPHGTYQDGCTRNLAGNFAQVHRATLVDPDHQPGERTQPRNPLVRPQLPDPQKPSMIESVDRHRLPPRELFDTPILLERGDAINPFVKVSGG